MGPVATLALLGLSFPSSGGSGSSGGGYWGDAYFENAFFGTDYWEDNTVPPEVYETLLEAVLAHLEDTLAADFPGGFWADLAPVGTEMPYLTITEVGQSSEGINTQGTRIETGEFQVAIYANAKNDARELGASVALELEDADLEFTEGLLMLLRQASRSSRLDADRDTNGAPVYQETRNFTFMYSRAVGG